MTVREPNLRVMTGPYLCPSLARIGPTSETECLSQRRLPRIGIETGPGGRLGRQVVTRRRRGLSSRARETVKAKINQASMVIFI